MDSAPATAGDPPTNEAKPPAWRRLVMSVFAMASVGSLLLWLAQPPAMLGWLGWAAPIPWLVVIHREHPLQIGAYLQLWLAGVLYWLLAVHWVRLPHPLTPIGWGFLAAYLGCYLPTFTWLCRSATRKGRFPLWVAAPIAWTGLELVQAHLFSGFLMGALSHTQAFYPVMIQIAEVLGAYGMSFALMACAALLTEALLAGSTRTGTPSFSSRAMPLTAAAMVIGFLTFYGYVADRRVSRSIDRVTLALIQGNTLATWDPDPSRNQRIMDQQIALTREAVRTAKQEGRKIDLIVWPESMFRVPLDFVEGEWNASPDTPQRLRDTQASARSWFAGLAEVTGSALLLGGDRFDWRHDESDDTWNLSPYNTSVLINPQGEVAAVYDKVHRVPFGEYVPLAESLPPMYFLTKTVGALRPGAGPVAMALETDSDQPVIVSPNICYETVIPHVIAGQVRELNDAGAHPHLLVNLTNDAWFWGSSELDMHLACDIFRAVETRTPMAIAANGGLSGVIDSHGRVRELSERMTEQAMVVEVPIVRAGPSPYTRYGDWFAGGCLIACGLAAIIGVSKAEGGRRKADE